jgi:cAMP-dependent protein kinase regulator
VLKKIDLLSSMDPYERTHVCDGIKEQKIKKGEYVIRQGETGDKFYMIEEGVLKATKTIDGWLFLF